MELLEFYYGLTLTNQTIEHSPLCECGKDTELIFHITASLPHSEEQWAKQPW